MNPITLSFLKLFSLLLRMPAFPSPYCPPFKLHTHHQQHIYLSFKAQSKWFLLCVIFLTIMLKFTLLLLHPLSSSYFYLPWTPFSLGASCLLTHLLSYWLVNTFGGLFTSVSCSLTPAFPSSHRAWHQICGQSVFTQKWMSVSSFPWYYGKLRTSVGPCVAKSSCFRGPCPSHSQFHTHTLALVLFSILIFCLVQNYTTEMTIGDYSYMPSNEVGRDFRELLLLPSS